MTIISDYYILTNYLIYPRKPNVVDISVYKLFKLVY